MLGHRGRGATLRGVAVGLSDLHGRLALALVLVILVAGGCGRAAGPSPGGLLIATADWAVGKVPVTGTCTADMTWTATPLHLASGEGSATGETATPLFTALPHLERQDNKFHCVFRYTVPARLRPGSWLVSVSSAGWSASCERLVSGVAPDTEPEPTSAQFVVGRPGCETTRGEEVSSGG